ncbi:hypothetical protein JCM19233_5625 [Vibrio astriarenae]|nr:hypothetical protein JCM19233_5625 [Vibrio sp. C7]
MMADVGQVLASTVGAFAKKSKSFDNALEAATSMSVTSSAARNPANSVKLNKQLSSQQQFGETGVSVAGAGSKTPLRDSKRLANEYGGNASDWSKRSSSQHITPEGRKFETHWYENSTTGQRVEPKTIVQDYLKGPK